MGPAALHEERREGDQQREAVKSVRNSRTEHLESANLGGYPLEGDPTRESPSG